MGRLLGFLENISYLCIVIKNTMFHRSYKSILYSIMIILLKVVLFIMWFMISFSPLPIMLYGNVDKVNGDKLFSNFWIGFVAIFYGAELFN